MENNHVTGLIVSAAMKVHTVLGPGLFENVYKACLQHELVKHELEVVREFPVSVHYEGVRFDLGYKIDLLVGKSVVVEWKAAKPNSLFEAQLLSYLRLSGIRLGLNFHVPSMKDGIKRMIL